MNTLQDKFGREHNYLRISLTERCNLRCFYCMPEEGIPLRDRKEFMSSEEIIAISKEFVQLGVNKIRLTGGEPLIKKDIANILEQLSELNVDLGITTNGILIDRYIDVLKKCRLDSINVSLDSLNEDKFNTISRRTYFKRIISNIDLLIREGFRVKINVVLIKGTNDDEIIDFIQLTQHKNVEVRFIEFMPFIGNNWDLERTITYQEIMDRAENVFGKTSILKLPTKHNATASSYKIKNAVGSWGIIGTVSNPFCDSCNRIRLTADGKIKNCLFSKDESDLLSAYRRGSDLKTIIKQALTTKEEMRGGIQSFEKSMDYLKNRSMTTIGG
jgi:molybdenum cofactor biosynthesis protein A